MTLEEFLRTLPKPLTIVGGSPLYADEAPASAISINGFRPECEIAAINSQASDARRVANVKHVIQPYPKRVHLERAMLPANHYPVPEGMPNKQPTTYFTLCMICEALEIDAHVYGICGWASRHHDGDWEMHYMKRKMRHITVHDPRPKW